MEEEINNELKKMYNERLKRYYLGCQYIKEHCKEADKWIPEVFNILEEMNLLLDEIQTTEIITNKQIGEGF